MNQSKNIIFLLSVRRVCMENFAAAKKNMENFANK